MKIKIIDLLQMKANNEKMPKEIIYDGYKWKLETDSVEEVYCNDEIEKCLFEDYIDKKWYVTEVLNDEVEIIEEPKKIEKIDIYDELDTFLDNNDYRLIKHSLHKAMKNLEITINEVIDKINEMSDK